MGLFGQLFKKKAKTASNEQAPPLSELIVEATVEVDRAIAVDATWYQTLPYSGAMSASQAREYEIERLALWRRVIYEAKATKLAGLKWITRNDDLTCPDCLQHHHQLFSLSEYDALAAIPRHLGCRCELVPVRIAGGS